MIGEVPPPNSTPPSVRDETPVPPTFTARVEVDSMPLVPLPSRICPADRVLWPVPPLATGRVPVTSLVKSTLVPKSATKALPEIEIPSPVMSVIGTSEPICI